MSKYLTLGQVALQLGCLTWQIQRLYQRGILPEPPRLGQHRLVTEKDLPKIRKALLEAGYLAA